MPRHSDAIGYLIELRDQESVAWFSKICDIAASSEGSSLTKTELQSLLEILIGKETYTPVTATPLISQTTTTTLPPHTLARQYLKEISNFTNFKRLSDTLRVVFDKRITLMFGCNGSGKTSLCEAIKLLATPEIPKNPLNNVRTQSNQPCSFTYQFEGDPNPSTWELSQGYGIYADRIKYFDSTIAIQNIMGSVVPDKVVKIEPFRLEVFALAGQFIRELNKYVSDFISSQREKVAQAIELIKTTFRDVMTSDEKAISSLIVSDCTELEQLLSVHSEFDKAEKRSYANNVASLDKLRKVRSADGLRLQQTELKLLLEYGHSIKDFMKKVQSASLRQAVEIGKKLSSQKLLHQDLAKRITPEEVDPVHFEQFIRASEKVFKYESPESESCPFCKRPFDEISLQVVRSYHEFLVDKIGDEIRVLETELNKIFSKLNKIREFSTPSNLSTIPLNQEVLIHSTSCIEKNRNLIPDRIGQLDKTNPEGYGDLNALKESVGVIAREVLQRHRAIRLSSSTEEEFEKRCNQLEAKIKEFQYLKCIDDNLDKLKDVVTSIKLCDTLENLIRIAGFPGVLRKITIKSKEAYNDLVVSEFERSLDDEYKRMTALKVSDFGIGLISTGTDQTVIVNTRVGNEPIHRVFSEGEQKIHALALFFGEASVSNHQIVVFDDPVASFDYNYSAMYAQRLRDYIVNNPDVQLIVLTHNWDFFVHMQLVINQSGLNSETSIKVLEDCCVAEEYSEKIDDLKTEIEATLGISGEPSRADKDRLAGNLRRLIESVVNTHVFNGERHQFKQKTISTSVFDRFTRVVPLLPNEAIKLRDHYRSLSVPEHEDPRNYYSLINKALYSQWYTEICDIENAIIARKP